MNVIYVVKICLILVISWSLSSTSMSWPPPPRGEGEVASGGVATDRFQPFCYVHTLVKLQKLIEYKEEDRIKLSPSMRTILPLFAHYHWGDEKSAS